MSDKGDLRVPVLIGAAGPTVAKACMIPCRVGTASTTKDAEAHISEAKAVSIERGRQPRPVHKRACTVPSGMIMPRAMRPM
jgi:hypothetical protein